MLSYSNCLFLVMLFAFGTRVLSAQITLIPDPVFEQHLIDEGIDSGTPDGQVFTINLQGIASLNLSASPKGEITDLTGIEDMKDLVILRCRNNKIEHLDLSGNQKLTQLNCAENFIKKLDLTKNFRLTKIWCANNELAQIDLTQNFDLTFLSAQYNALSEINVRNNAFLENLYVFENNLETLDLSNNTNLKVLLCGDNKLSELNVSNSKLLSNLNFSDNLLTEIDVSQNKELRALFCIRNEISTLDVSQNEKLEVLNCFGNQLTHVNFSLHPKLGFFDCSQNQLTHLDVSMLEALNDFNCSDNSLVCLNVQNGRNNQFSGFEAQNNPSLTCIEVDDPVFSMINWSKVDPYVSFALSCDNDCSTVGTKEIQEELPARLFPNPSTETIQVEFAERIGAGTWTIFNPIGQKILNQNFANTDVLSLNPDLPAGVYLLRVELDKGLSKSFKIYRE